MTGGAAPRRKGSQWERDVRDYLRFRGFDAERVYGAGRPDDVGDLVVGAFVPLLIEAKNVARPERARWIDAARRKVAAWRNAAVPVVVEKRRARPVEDAFVTLDLAGFCDLIQRVARRIVELEERDLDLDDPRTGAR